MTPTLLLALLLLLPAASPKCDNQLQCFKTKLFNFDSPGQGIYPIPNITNQDIMSELNILGYGDFNNDLHTDFVGQSLTNGGLAVYLWSVDEVVFVRGAAFEIGACNYTSVLVYDANMDGLLDVVGWGVQESGNCLVPYIQTSPGTYTQGSVTSMQPTSSPFVISYGVSNDQTRIVGLMSYFNGSRTVLKYQSGSFASISWNVVFPNYPSYAGVGFASPHWNSYLDITGDCRGDVVIVNANNQLQFWININNTFMLQNSTITVDGQISSLSFNDMNYDGLVDMLLANTTTLTVYLNSRQLKHETDFCWHEYRTVTFSTQHIMKLQFPTQYILPKSALQLKDINIDGYPDVMVALRDQAGQTEAGDRSAVVIFMNDGGKGFVDDADNGHYRLPVNQFRGLISVSFVDFLENGIMDVMVSTETGTFAYYNNYLQQNLFFIKGYGATGANASTGALIIGASFYWINSLGETYRTAFQPQVFQTAYSALQTPYAYCGLGRSNNYVQSFTLGMYGQSNPWSPIIPNSQLAVYATGPDTEKWAIRIFVLPRQSLIYVIIVSVMILAVLGVVLGCIKCKNYRRKDQPYMELIH